MSLDIIPEKTFNTPLLLKVINFGVEYGYERKLSCSYASFYACKNLDKKIAIQFVTDEEIGGFNGTKYQIQEGLKTNFVLATEPTNLILSMKQKELYS